MNTFLNIKGHENGELNFFLIIPFLRVFKIGEREAERERERNNSLIRKPFFKI